MQQYRKASSVSSTCITAVKELDFAYCLVMFLHTEACDRVILKMAMIYFL